MNKYSLLLVILLIKMSTLSAQQQLDTNMIHKLNATIYLQRAYNEESGKDKDLFFKIESGYKAILLIDSLYMAANYGLGSLYYNEAIFEYNKLSDKIQKSTQDNINMQNVDKEQKKIDNYKSLSKFYLDRYHRIKGESPVPAKL